MTSLPDMSRPGQKKLGLVIDLDTCVGCQACVTSCKEWNDQGYSAPLNDVDPYGASASGTWLNRVHGYEVTEAGRDDSRIVHFPRSCLHCEEPACVTVCPTGASYKRAGGRHRPRQSGNLHRLQAVFLGLPLWRARVRCAAWRHEEMHAVRGPHLQREFRGGRPRAGLRASLPNECAAFRRPWRSIIAGVKTRGGARRLRPAA